MTVDQMREQIIKVYPGERWRNKVALMPDRQVVAIYKCMKRRGDFEKKKEKKPYETAVQLTIWTLLND